MLIVFLLGREILFEYLVVTHNQKVLRMERTMLTFEFLA